MTSAMGWRWRRGEGGGTGESRQADGLIDLVDSTTSAPPPPEPTPEQIATARSLAERRRADAARREAEDELRRLRQRHWSAQRIYEESHLEIDFWAHPLADPYAVLGLLPGASLHEASIALRRIARQCHPDLAGAHELAVDAAARMSAANAAYERLRRALRSVS